MRKHEVVINDIEVEAFESGIKDVHDVIRINWSGNIGWGMYTLHKDNEGYWIADSECLDSNDDKSVLKALFNKFVDEIVVEG